MKIDPTSQSLISLGGSPEEDRRFDRAIRLNGARELSNFTHVIPPASAGTVDTGETVVQTQSGISTDVGKIDTPRASRPAVRGESRGWEALYRMVMQGDDSLQKSDELDVVA